MKKTAVELGFKSQVKPMNEELSKLFTKVCLMELTSKSRETTINGDLPFVIKVLNKRIEILKLPISFTLEGQFALSILAEQNPGRMMVGLIDCLTKYEGKIVSTKEVAETYPMGFYTEESVIEYVEKYVKTRLCKWSEIY